MDAVCNLASLLEVVVLLGCLAGTSTAQDMMWNEANDSRALCNDFTQAGFFLRRNRSSNSWVIFLEGGSLCYSNDTCNRRFFRSDVSTLHETRDGFPDSTTPTHKSVGKSCLVFFF